MSDLLASAATLVDIPSTSHHEHEIAEVIESQLRAAPWLEVQRVGNNVVARTDLGRPRRLILAGHLDTVPANGNGFARIDGDILSGLGAADMKAGLAVMTELARTIEDPTVDLTYVFYECEEVDQRFSGLRRLSEERPQLLSGDSALLGEPSGGVVEAGCQGTLRLRVNLAGKRAHTARAWMGVNAIHRSSLLLYRVAGYEGRRPVLDGCEYREALQAVAIEGGVAPNVVPDTVKVTLNHRFAPDRGPAEARAHIEADVLGAALDAPAGDTVSVEDVGDSAPPNLDDPILASLVGKVGAPPRAKLGWTDVAFFAARAIPAANFGPGDPSLAHTPQERVSRSEVEGAHAVLSSLLTSPL